MNRKKKSKGKKGASGAFGIPNPSSFLGKTGKGK